MNIVAFIFRNFVEPWGIIKGVPTGFSDQEILENVSSPVKINFIERLVSRKTSKNWV